MGEQIINKEKFKAELETSYGDFEAWERIALSEYSNAQNIRDIAEGGLLLNDINKIAILYVTNDHVHDSYKVVVLFNESGTYYATTPGVIESISGYIDIMTDESYTSITLQFSMAESKNRRGAKFLKVALKGFK